MASFSFSIFILRLFHTFEERKPPETVALPLLPALLNITVENRLFRPRELPLPKSKKFVSSSLPLKVAFTWRICFFSPFGPFGDLGEPLLLILFVTSFATRGRTAFPFNSKIRVFFLLLKIATVALFHLLVFASFIATSTSMPLSSVPFLLLKIFRVILFLPFIMYCVLIASFLAVSFVKNGFPVSGSITCVNISFS